jgi:peroxiredoxin
MLKQPARPGAWFYLSLALATLLILSGVWVLWQVSQTSSSNEVTADRFATPPPSLEAAPDFSLHTLDGRVVALSDYRGRVVLLNTWATWCPPCLAEMPDLEAYYRQHQDDGFVVLAVNDGESPGAVAAFVEERGFTFPVLLDPEGVVLDAYDVRGLPTSFFIDREGVVRGVWMGQLSPDRLKTIVDPLL